MSNAINRRRFLQGSLAGAAAATVSLGKNTEAATFEGYPDAMGVLVDLSRCVGCRSCEAVCPQQIRISEAMADFTAKLNA